MMSKYTSSDTDLQEKTRLKSIIFFIIFVLTALGFAAFASYLCVGNAMMLYNVGFLQSIKLPSNPNETDIANFMHFIYTIGFGLIAIISIFYSIIIAFKSGFKSFEYGPDEIKLMLTPTLISIGLFFIMEIIYKILITIFIFFSVPETIFLVCDVLGLIACVIALVFGFGIEIGGNDMTKVFKILLWITYILFVIPYLVKLTLVLLDVSVGFLIYSPKHYWPMVTCMPPLLIVILVLILATIPYVEIKPSEKDPIIIPTPTRKKYDDTYNFDNLSSLIDTSSIKADIYTQHDTLESREDKIPNKK